MKSEPGITIAVVNQSNWKFGFEKKFPEELSNWMYTDEFFSVLDSIEARYQHNIEDLKRNSQRLPLVASSVLKLGIDWLVPTIFSNYKSEQIVAIQEDMNSFICKNQRT